MDRDGIYTHYKKFKISQDLEKIWITELVNLKLINLDKKGNWNSVYFLNHHSNFNHLDKILISEPLGKYWEKCAFLEELFAMSKNMRLSKNEIHIVLNFISDKGTSIVKNTKNPTRIKDLLAKIKQYELPDN
ncbi:hypothetical protein [Frigoriflavimonas asaccharolytica]|uniref:Uncharacterized protein n=1 Tax=Frigoriflavimonas asaccharolytica TaxID=2735899 RepID=A0A8J8K4V6_9FLAO|nr:hypothetical protein [Frigoriflavimonas asaccharolytica]NRS92160.1 hypothetical protein [Frigoriflavimonas asaccharolytica]